MLTPPDDATPTDLIAHALTIALGARDHYTRIHCDRVVELSRELGQKIGSKPFPVEIDFSTYMTVAPVVAGDCRHQGALR